MGSATYFNVLPPTKTNVPIMTILVTIRAAFLDERFLQGLMGAHWVDLSRIVYLSSTIYWLWGNLLGMWIAPLLVDVNGEHLSC